MKNNRNPNHFVRVLALCVVLAPALAPAATKGAAPAAQPEPLNAFAPIEAKKDDKKDEKKDEKKDDKGKGATPAPAPADAASTATSGAATPPSAAAAPATSAPPAPAVVTTPAPTATAPAAAANAAAPPPSPASSPDPLSQFMHDISVTDIAVALFALFVAVFAWRVSRASAGSGATAQTFLDANRRAIEASERAAEAAKRSAEAAERSATVLQDTAARQLRPYVTVKEFLQGPVKDENNFLHGWVFQVVWQNSGATPTRGFRYWAALRQFDHEIPADFDFAPPVMADFAGGELGSQSTVTSGTLFVPQADVTLIQSASRKAVLYGKAEYQDVLGGDAKRDTRFAVEVILVADPGGANGTPFSFSYYPRHNSIT